MPLAMNPNKVINIDKAAAVKLKAKIKRKPTIKSTTKSIIKSKVANPSQNNIHYIDMIREAIENLKSITTYAKRGVSQQAIKKVIIVIFCVFFYERFLKFHFFTLYY